MAQITKRKRIKILTKRNQKKLNTIADLRNEIADLKNKVINLAQEGLLTDGGHHKQWYLEQIIKKLMGEEWFDNNRESLKDMDYEWEDGIAP